uniref:Im:7150988 n=1 Tax=Sphaeramia orbicularis TaxID=375764 RepID=A0A672YVF4_9TELE
EGKNESFKKEFLDTHNAYRAKHSTPPVKYNEELNAAAQKWADHMLQINTLQHSDTKDGENVFSSWSSETLNPTGHFTQVVWKETTEVGVGVATDGNKLFVVGQYRPAGNMVMPGYFEKNVLPLGKTLPQFVIFYLLIYTFAAS